MQQTVAAKTHQLEHAHFAPTNTSIARPTMKEVHLFTDGAARGNPGPGGYGLILELPGTNHKKEHAEGFLYTTNNRMELYGSYYRSWNC